MEIIRSFIAIELGNEIQVSLAKLISSIAPLTQAVKWVPAANIHLTLQFLGDLPASTVPILYKSLFAGAGSIKPFEFRIHGIGAFPSLRRPRVIWAGIQAPLELVEFQKRIEDITFHMGFPREERGFSPHLTLGRIHHQVNPTEVMKLGEILTQKPVGYLGTCKVDGLTLFRSDLRPTGSVYTRLYEIRFGANNTLK